MSVRTLSQQKLSLKNFNRTISPVGYGSVLFNGSDQYLEIADNAGFRFGSGDFTVEWWMKPLAVSACSPVGKNYGGGSWEFYYNWYSDRSMTFAVQDDSITSGVASVPANTWTHIAGVRTSGTRKLFINGVQAASTSTAVNINSTNTIHIGGGDSLGGFFNGYISNVRVLNGVAAYTSNFTVPTTPLTAITGTQLLACQGTLLDNGPNTFAMTLHGTPTASTVNPFR